VTRLRWLAAVWMAVAGFFVLVVYPLSHLVLLRIVGRAPATASGLAASGVSTPES
jgi:hypothetical protein